MSTTTEPPATAGENLSFLAANDLRMILARSHMDQQLSFLHKVSEPSRLHCGPIVGYQNDLARKLPQINDLFECAFHHCNQVQCRFALGDLRDQIKPTQVLAHTTDPMLLAIFAQVIGKSLCKTWLIFSGRLEPLPTLFGRLAQIVTDA